MRIYFLLSVMAVLLAVTAQAQRATLRGTVSDSQGELLTGANVFLQEADKGAASDFDGRYELKELKPGEYSVLVSFIGYETQRRQIRLVEGNNTLDVVLSPGAIVLDGLIVTAQKREQSIKEIPTALTSLDARFLQNGGITELDYLSEFVPGVQIQIQSPNNPGFVIRGITSDNGASNIEPRVSVFQDGVSISKSRGSVVEVFDMERVEVLKGPQGTLFGRGAQIGAVHFIQNKAQNKTEGAFTAGYGDYNYTHLEGYFNTPIAKDKLFFRAAGIYKKRDGFIKNLSGGDLNGKDTKALRLSARYKPTPMTNIDLIYNYQKDTPPGTAFKSGTYAPTGGDTKPWTFADLDRGEELGLDRSVGGATLIARHSFSSNFSITSTTAYREFDSYESFDADGTAAPALWFAEDAFGKQFSQEFRANFKINNKLEGFAGASYFFEDGFARVPFETNEQSLAVLMSNLSDLTSTVNTGILNPINEMMYAYFGINPGMAMSGMDLCTDGVPNYVNNLAKFVSNSAYLAYLSGTGYEYIYQMFYQDLVENHSESYTNYGRNQAYEIFVDGTYKFSDKFKLTAGVRYSFEDIESGYEATTDPDGNDGTLGFALSAGTNDLFMPTEKLSDSDTYSSFVGRLAASYSVSKQTEVYASVSKGRRPNVIQFTSEANGDYTSTYYVEKLNDEIVWSYELGAKGLSSSQQFYYDLAVFYYDYSDFQTSSVEDLQIITIDAGNATARGFESSLKWQLNKTLNVFGNYAFIDASFDDEDSDGNEQDYAGNTFRLTPKHSFAVGCELNVALGQNTNAFIRPYYNYKSKVYFDEDNGDDVMQEGYSLLNLRGGIERSGFQLELFMNNVLDKKYIIDAGNTGRNFGIPTYIAGAPRFLGAELSYRF